MEDSIKIDDPVNIDNSPDEDNSNKAENSPKIDNPAEEGDFTQVEGSNGDKNFTKIEDYNEIKGTEPKVEEIIEKIYSFKVSNHCNTIMCNMLGATNTQFPMVCPKS